jgi:hypothetical protein
LIESAASTPNAAVAAIETAALSNLLARKAAAREAAEPEPPPSESVDPKPEEELGPESDPELAGLTVLTAAINAAARALALTNPLEVDLPGPIPAS